MATFDVDTNAALVAADLQALGVRAGVKAFATTRHFGMILQTNWRRRASQPRTTPRGPGTGGLRLMTGDYNRRVVLTMSLDAGGPVASVGTDHPGGRRLEMGFRGTDSLGRRVNAPPYPTAEPALAETAPAFIAAIAALVDR
jgi:hypothetical protein